jgi:hypothetical protein
VYQISCWDLGAHSSMLHSLACANEWHQRGRKFRRGSTLFLENFWLSFWKFQLLFGFLTIILT